MLLANPIRYRTCKVEWQNDLVRIRSYRRDHITKAFKRGHYYEIDFLEMIAERYSSPGVFVDVGAFVGNHSLFFARHCGADRVVAFEPFPETFSLLRHNIKRNRMTSTITPVHCAVSDQPGTLSMTVVRKKNRGMNRITEDGNVRVNVTTLDERLKDLQEPISFIKIDAEGHGAKVLKGAREILSMHRPVVAVEVDPENVDDESTSRVTESDEATMEVMQSLGYVPISCHNYTPTWIFEHEANVARRAA